MARIYKVRYRNPAGKTRDVTVTANTKHSAERWGRLKLPKRTRRDWWPIWTVFHAQ